MERHLGNANNVRYGIYEMVAIPPQINGEKRMKPEPEKRVLQI